MEKQDTLCTWTTFVMTLGCLIFNQWHRFRRDGSLCWKLGLRPWYKKVELRSFCIRDGWCTEGWVLWSEGSTVSVHVRGAGMVFCVLHISSPLSLSLPTVLTPAYHYRILVNRFSTDLDSWGIQTKEANEQIFSVRISFTCHHVSNTLCSKDFTPYG